MSDVKPVRKKKGSLLIWGLLVLVVLLIVVFASSKKPEEKLDVEEERAVAVRTVGIELRSVPDTIRLPARIEPMQEARLPAERPGRVVERLVDKGDAVKKGQRLLRVDDRLWKAAQRRAEIEDRDARRDLKRWKELEKTGAVSASDYEAVVRRKESAEIALDEAQVFVDQCEARSPFAGVIVDRYVEVGDYANEGQAVFHLIRLDRVKLAFDVPEQDIGALQPGQELTFTLAALPGREFTGKVAFVSSQAARDSNSFAVELEVDNPDGALKAGMMAQVTMVRRIRDNTAVVPLAAVVPHKGEHYVFVAENGRAVRKRVLIGAMIGSEAVLDSGLSAGERVVVEGHRGLQDGMMLTVADETPEGGAEEAPVSESVPEE